MKSQPTIHKYTKQNEQLTKSAKKQKKSKGKTNEQSRNGRGTVEEQSRKSRGTVEALLFRYCSSTFPLLVLCFCALLVKCPLCFVYFVDFRLIFHVFC